MTRTTNSRLAGLAFLVYIAAGLSGLILFGRASAGETVPARLASLAANTSAARAGLLLTVVGVLCAFVLAVTLHGLTRDVDPDLALLVLAFRTAEGVVGGVGLLGMAERIWLATVSPPAAPDPAAAKAIGAMLFQLSSRTDTVSAMFFAFGSLVFSWLLVRGRLAPAWLAWVGVVASILIAVGLPLDLAGALPKTAARAMWAPMILFEVPLGFWLIFQGARAPVGSRAAG
jgi:hypothetical protein